MLAEIKPIKKAPSNEAVDRYASKVNSKIDGILPGYYPSRGTSKRNLMHPTSGRVTDAVKIFVGARHLLESRNAEPAKIEITEKLKQTLEKSDSVYVETELRKQMHAQIRAAVPYFVKDAKNKIAQNNMEAIAEGIEIMGIAGVMAAQTGQYSLARDILMSATKKLRMLSNEMREVSGEKLMKHAKDVYNISRCEEIASLNPKYLFINITNYSKPSKKDKVDN